MIKTERVAGSKKTGLSEARKKPARKGKTKPIRKPSSAAKPKAEKPKAEKPAAGNNGGGNPPKLTARDIPKVIEVLRLAGGIKTAAAVMLQVGRTTLYAFLNEHPEIQAAAAEIDEELLDIAEGQVVAAIRTGDLPTVRWFMELKGKERGYVRRVESTGKNGGPVEHAQKLDLSKLTDEELEIMYRAAERRESGATQG